MNGIADLQSFYCPATTKEVAHVPTSPPRSTSSARPRRL